MDKDTKGINVNRQFIALMFILIVAIFFIFYLLNAGKEAKKAKPLTTMPSTTINVGDGGNVSTTIAPSFEEITTTKSIVDQVEDMEKDTTPIVASNFKASLLAIIGDRTFDKNYKTTFRYSGAEFSFNCTHYDSSNNKCNEGSGLMNVGTASIPLYTYKNEKENYLLRAEDYFIMLTDNNIIISTAYSFNSAGTTKIYDRNGKFIRELDDVLLSYKLGNLGVTEMYPSITDDNFYYYTCFNNKVGIAGYDLINNKELGIDEMLDGASCY